MNIINKTFLKLALLPQAVYNKMGVDIPQLKAILITKLTMDDRRPSALHQTQSKKDKPVKAATIMTMVLSAVMGALFLLAFSFGNNYYTHFTIYFSIFFVMLSASLISDFTSVLIDVRDNFIILPKPVTDKTFVTARMLHIFIHICKIIVPMALPAVIFLFTRAGIAGSLVFALMILMVSMFSIFFINALYILILKVTTPAKFQSIISYIQIIFAIAIYGSYQIVPRMFGSAMGDLDVNDYSWMIAVPFYWFASSWTVINEMGGSTQQVVAAILGIILPVTSLFVVIKYLAPSFNNKLAMINNSGAEVKTRSKTIKKRGYNYSGILSRLLSFSTAERTGFLIAWKLSARSRDFKLKVYPSIGYLFVYAIFIFWNSSRETLETLQEESLSSRALIISVLYFTTLILTMSLNQMVYSEKYKASWIYHTTPLVKPGEIILGAAKAMMMKFYIPMVFIITISGTVLLGIRIIPHIILGMFNVLLIASILVYTGIKVFPFSMHQNNNSNTGGFMRGIFILIIAGLIGVLHFAVYEFTVVIWIFAAMSIAATWMVMSAIRTTSWVSIKSRYADD